MWPPVNKYPLLVAFPANDCSRSIPLLLRNSVYFEKMQNAKCKQRLDAFGSLWEVEQVEWEKVRRGNQAYFHHQLNWVPISYRIQLSLHLWHKIVRSNLGDDMVPSNKIKETKGIYMVFTFTYHECRVQWLAHIGGSRSHFLERCHLFENPPCTAQSTSLTRRQAQYVTQTKDYTENIE